MSNSTPFWKSFWDEYPLKADPLDYLKQVGKTVNGEDIADTQFRAILEDIDQRLEFQQEDVVLDLCCGNGLITREIASRCKSVLGVDFSSALVTQARQITTSSNTSYMEMDVREIGNLNERYYGKFTKVLWYEALAFFEEEDLYEILRALRVLTSQDAVILIGSVLDYERKWSFFNTVARKLNYAINFWLLGREKGLGKWWKKSDIRRICADVGFSCYFHAQNAILHTSHYRIDVKVILEDKS